MQVLHDIEISTVVEMFFEMITYNTGHTKGYVLDNKNSR